MRRLLSRYPSRSCFAYLSIIKKSSGALCDFRMDSLLLKANVTILSNTNWSCTRYHSVWNPRWRRSETRIKCSLIERWKTCMHAVYASDLSLNERRTTSKWLEILCENNSRKCMSRSISRILNCLVEIFASGTIANIIFNNPVRLLAYAMKLMNLLHAIGYHVAFQAWAGVKKDKIRVYAIVRTLISGQCYRYIFGISASRIYRNC